MKSRTSAASHPLPPLRIINSAAPMRICDIGGWTDTWFAGHGQVFNMAIYPCAEVQIRVFRQAAARPGITIHAENYGQSYRIAKPRGRYDRHPLLEAALEYMPIPDHARLEIGIFSAAPAGCSIGTSAAVSVALIGALDCLTPGRLSLYQVARAAHRIETELLHQQCGIQDQLASAYGGINIIEMEEYPRANVSAVAVPDPLAWELESRLSLVYAGTPHSSSDVHRMVIRDLEDAGPDCPKLVPLRRNAQRAREALVAGDLTEFGRVMSDNTEAQRALHPDLIGPALQQIIDLARAHGALGWKVNGAGGSGGSVTLLSGPDLSRKRAMLAAIEQAGPAFRTIPIRLSRHGLRLWESPIPT